MSGDEKCDNFVATLLVGDAFTTGFIAGHQQHGKQVSPVSVFAPSFSDELVIKSLAMLKPLCYNEYMQWGESGERRFALF